MKRHDKRIKTQDTSNAQEEKQFEIILADPPWQYRDKKGPGWQGASSHYSTIPLNDLCRLPISDLANPKSSALLLWIVPPMLQEGLTVMRFWGFTYKTIAFCWVKMEQNGNTMPGVGSYFRSNCEICLLGTRGKIARLDSQNKTPLFIRQSESQVITTFRQNMNGKWHSRKPQDQYRKIDKLFNKEAKRLELFARQKQPGWDVWGNQIESTISLKETT